MIKLGITGGSGCGKTTVSEMLRKKGIDVIDTDKVARIIVETGKPALAEIIEHFGMEYINSDGTLNRRKLGNYVFSNPCKLLELNRITHKYISEYIEEYIDNYSGKIIGIDGAALIESGISEKCDYLLSVLCDEDKRIERIIYRDKIPFDDAKKRIKAQKNDEFYEENSDFIVYNNGNNEELEVRLCNIINEIIKIKEEKL